MPPVSSNLLSTLLFCVVHAYIWPAGTLSSAITCPEGCTCEHKAFQGLVTTCSDLGENRSWSALTTVSTETKFLYLEGNNMTSFPGRTMKNLHHLNSLFLAGNSLEDLRLFSAALPNTTRATLLSLDLSENGISSCTPEAFPDYPQLQSLCLKDNNIKKLAGGSFRSLAELKILDISRNVLASLPQDTFLGLGALEHLLLSSNKIELLEGSVFRHLGELKMLDLSDNDLHSTLSWDSLLGLESLQTLHLNNNGITDIPDGLYADTSHILQVSLQSNRLRSIPIESMANLQHLQYLYLDFNEIQAVPWDLGRLSSVQFLYLSYNRIYYIDPQALQGADQLESLWLDHNRLSSLPAELLSSFVRMQYGALKFEANPFHCDCTLVWLGRWLRHQVLPAFVTELPVCSSPNNHTGKRLDQLELRDFLCVTIARTDATAHFHSAARICRRYPDSETTRINIGSIVLLSRFADGAVPNATECRHRLTKSNPGVCVTNVFQAYSPVSCQDGAETSGCLHRKQQLCTGSGASPDTCLCAGDTCHVCPPGSFGDHSADGSQTCWSCPAFATTTLGASSIHECQCSHGYEPDAQGVCQPCRPGFYKDVVGPGQCSPCPPGSLTYYEAATLCECAAGYSPSKQGYCKLCEENTYKERNGKEPCRKCPPYSRSPAGTNSSGDCTCIYGEFKQITNRKYGSCQEFEHQEEVGMGLVPPPSGLRTDVAAEEEEPVHRHDLRQLEVGSLVGGVSALVLLLCGAIALVLRRRRTRKTDSSDVSEESTPINGIRRVQSMLDEYVQNTMYAQYELPRRQIELGPLIGQGAFGKVFQATAKGFGQGGKPIKVAVKMLRENATEEEEEALRVELDQMMYVGQHPNIVSLIGACTQGLAGQLMLVMEYASNGNLLNYLKRYNKEDPYRRRKIYAYKINDHDDVMCGRDVMQDKQLMTFAWQIARGMEHMANMKCIHRDLAARNVLLSDQMVAKVCDFGLAREVYESGYYFKNSKGRLPFKWMSPEALLNGHSTTKSDVWSFGITLWEVATYGSTPYPGIPPEQMYDMLKAGYRMRSPQGCSHKLYEIMLHCWHEVPADRPSFRELVARFDKIVQEAAKKEYLDLQSDDGIWDPASIPDMRTASDGSSVSPYIQKSPQADRKHGSNPHELTQTTQETQGKEVPLLSNKLDACLGESAGVISDVREAPDGHDSDNSDETDYILTQDGSQGNSTGDICHKFIS